MTSAPVLSFSGSARRLWALNRGPRPLLVVTVPLFVVAVVVWWMFIAVYYVLASCLGALPLLVGWRVVRRVVCSARR